jgi:hypothetical protein
MWLAGQTPPGGPSRKPPHWSSVATLLIGLVGISLNFDWSRLVGQTSASEPLHYEVASVKAYAGAPGRIFINQKGTRYVASGISLRGLIQIAYNVQSDQMIGGPKWIDSAHFDIETMEKPDTPSSGCNRRPADAATGDDAIAPCRPVRFNSPSRDQAAAGLYARYRPERRTPGTTAEPGQCGLRRPLCTERSNPC